MRSFGFRERGTFWPTFLTILAVVLGIIVLVIALAALTDGALAIPTPILAGLSGGLAAGISTQLGAKRTLSIGNGWLVLSDPKQELARIALQDLARARVYFKRVRNLELTSRGGEPLVLSPFPASNLPDEIVDFLRLQLPHLEAVNPVKANSKLRKERIIDFPPAPPGGWDQFRGGRPDIVMS